MYIILLISNAWCGIPKSESRLRNFSIIHTYSCSRVSQVPIALHFTHQQRDKAARCRWNTVVYIVPSIINLNAFCVSFCNISNFFSAVEPCNNDLKRILNELAALQSPNSIARAASVSTLPLKVPCDTVFHCIFIPLYLSFTTAYFCPMFTEPSKNVQQWEEAGCF